MKKRSKELTVAFCGIAFIIIGGGIIKTWAVEPLIEVNEWLQNPTCSDLMVCTPKQTIRFIGTDQDGNVKSTLEGTIEFKSRGQFAMNKPIYYNIQLESTNPEFIKEINFIIADKNEDFSSKINNTKKFFDDMKHDHRLINIIKISDNKYQRSAYWTIDAPIEQVFAVFITTPDDSVTLAATTTKLFDVISPEAKIQDDANIEARITNKQILGLTWIGIGLGFALLGSDFLVRVILKEN